MTEEEIENLIKVKKYITIAPSRELRIDKMQKRKDFEIESENGDRFKVFIRQHVEFLENFSIGLTYVSPEGKKFMLFRANGNHGETVKDPWRPSPHFGYHFHRLTAEEIESRNTIDPKFKEITEEYSSLEGAIQFFVRETNIEGADPYFPFLGQLNIFE